MFYSGRNLGLRIEGNGAFLCWAALKTSAHIRGIVIFPRVCRLRRQRHSWRKPDRMRGGIVIIRHRSPIDKTRSLKTGNSTGRYTLSHVESGYTGGREKERNIRHNVTSRCVSHGVRRALASIIRRERQKVLASLVWLADRATRRSPRHRSRPPAARKRGTATSAEYLIFKLARLVRLRRDYRKGERT